MILAKNIREKKNTHKLFLLERTKIEKKIRIMNSRRIIFYGENVLLARFMSVF